jgi:hypothetical protein
MPTINTLSRGAGRLASEVLRSLRRARLEAERKLLQRKRGAALTRLGERVHQLVEHGGLPRSELESELGMLEAALAEISANDSAIAALHATLERGRAAGEGQADSNGGTGGAGPGWEAAARFFKRGS